MMDVNQIKEELLNDESAIGKEIAEFMISFTACLLAVDASGSHVALAGTGTFVTIDGSHFILTANHVWTEKLERASYLMIPLTEGAKNSFNIPVKTIDATALPRNRTYSEWGPDLVLLRIPSAFVGTIKSRRTFYNLATSHSRSIAADHLDCWILMGTPAEFGVFAGNHADVLLMGMLAFATKDCEKGGWDCIDVPVSLTKRSLPKDFGGVSGGGLWKLNVFWSEESNRVDWTYELAGVSFYQLPVEANATLIRCNGQNAIEELTKFV
ncbi:MAG: hypothetical protein WAM91_16080 [Candidatus Acidiferrales bacterium]